MKLGRMMDNLHDKSFSTAESGCPILEQTVTFRIVPINLNSSSCDLGQSCGIHVPTNRVRLSTTKERPHRFACHSSPVRACAFCLLFRLSSLVEWLAAQNEIGHWNDNAI